MKIAIFSDIHANLPAFQAFLVDLNTQDFDAIFCLGDLVGYHISPNEVIREIRKRSIPTISGNHDQKVIGLETTEDRIAEGGKNYAYHIIEQKWRKYLSTLPAQIKLSYQFKDEAINIALTHGSTRKVDEYVLIDTNEQYVLDMMAEAGADILCVGHSHKPYHRILKDRNGEYKHIINPGSIGKPKDGDSRGSYVLLTIDETKPAPEKVSTAFIRVKYDLQKSMAEILKSPLPNELAEALEQAR